ncbi:MAG: acyltransferase [Clostridia bacterium]|nr:acyltransferase [Clostridia bacterium]
MVSVPFVILLIIFLGAKLSPNGTYNDEYLSLENTNALRGMCALIVTMQHITAYHHDEWTSFFMYIGFLSTSIFFFLSGYGLMYSTVNKKRYLKNFLKKRLMTILIPYLFANVIYLGIRQAIGVDTTVVGFINSYKTGEPYVSFSWYIVSIIYFYIMFYACFNIFKRNVAVFLMIPVSILYIFLVKKAGFDNYWYTTAFCFAGGVFWHHYYDVLTSVARKQGFLKIFVILCITITLLVATFKNKYFYVAGSNITAILFQVLMMLCLQRIRIHNFILEYLGKISFEFYMVHGIVITLLNSYFKLSGNIYVYLTLLASVALASLLYVADTLAVGWVTGKDFKIKR